MTVFYNEVCRLLGEGPEVGSMLTDNGEGFCGSDGHSYRIYLELNDIEQRNSKVGRPQINGFAERFNRTTLDEFFREAFRRKLYESVEAPQRDLDDWLDHNKENGFARVTGTWEGDRSRVLTSAYRVCGKKLNNYS